MARPRRRDQFRAETDAAIARIRAETMAEFGKTYSRGPTRLVFEETDPRGYADSRRSYANIRPRVRR